MNTIRKLKLSKLTGINYLSDKEKNIINFVNSKLENLSEFTMDNYPTTIFYMNSKGEYVLEYDTKNMCLWIRNSDFWKVLEVEYVLDYNYIRDILQYMIESSYKLKVETTQFTSLFPIPKVESAYRNTLIKNRLYKQ